MTCLVGGSSGMTANYCASLPSDNIMHTQNTSAMLSSTARGESYMGVDGL